MENLIDPVIIVDNGRIIFNHSVEEVMDNFSFQLLDNEPAAGEAVYYEKVLGGYLAAVRGRGDEGRALDMEFLFNMVINSGEEVNRYMGGGEK